MQLRLAIVMVGCLSASLFGALSPRGAVADRLAVNQKKVNSARQELLAEAGGYSDALDLVEDSKKVFEAYPDDSTAALLFDLSLLVARSRRRRFEMAEQAAEKALSESQEALQAARDLRAVLFVDTTKE